MPPPPGLLAPRPKPTCSPCRARTYQARAFPARSSHGLALPSGASGRGGEAPRHLRCAQIRFWDPPPGSPSTRVSPAGPLAAPTHIETAKFGPFGAPAPPSGPSRAGDGCPVGGVRSLGLAFCPPAHPGLRDIGRQTALSRRVVFLFVVWSRAPITGTAFANER